MRSSLDLCLNNFRFFLKSGNWNFNLLVENFRNGIINLLNGIENGVLNLSVANENLFLNLLVRNESLFLNLLVRNESLFLNRLVRNENLFLNRLVRNENLFLNRLVRNENLFLNRLVRNENGILNLFDKGFIRFLKYFYFLNNQIKTWKSWRFKRLEGSLTFSQHPSCNESSKIQRFRLRNDLLDLSTYLLCRNRILFQFLD